MVVVVVVCVGVRVCACVRVCVCVILCACISLRYQASCMVMACLSTVNFTLQRQRKIKERLRERVRVRVRERDRRDRSNKHERQRQFRRTMKAGYKEFTLLLGIIVVCHMHTDNAGKNISHCDS
jgi:hypothetical protein